MNDKQAMRSALSTIAFWCALTCAVAMVGCGPVKKAADWITGSGDSSSEGTDADGDGVPDSSPAGQVVELLKSTGPLGAAGATIISFLAGRYVSRRKKEAVA